MRRFYTLLLLLISEVALAQTTKLVNLSAGETTHFTLNDPIEYKGKLYFGGTTLQTGFELFVTDGEPGGQTGLFKDLIPGAAGSAPDNFVIFNDKLFFTAHNVEGKQTLWCTDGTAENTKQVLDIYAQSVSLSYAAANGFLYLPVNSPDTGTSIWKTDGTVAGTSLVKDFSGNAFNPIGGLIAVGSTIYFSMDDEEHGMELWKTDGTPQGTAMVKDINPNGSGLDITNSWIAIGSRLFFSAQDVSGFSAWTSDGTDAGTVRLGFVGFKRGLTVYKGEVYFWGSLSETGEEVYKTDGTLAGTQVVKDINPGSETSSMLDSYDFYEYNGHLYFFARGSNFSVNVWRTDGTSEGTTKVHQLSPFGTPNALNFVGYGNKFLVATRTSSQLGGELFVSDGTVLKNVSDKLPAGNRYIVGMKLGNKGVFYYPFPLYGMELGRFTDAGEFVLIKDIETHAAEYPRRFVSLGSKALFVGKDAEHGRELWVTDGSVEGTKLLKDIKQGPMNMFYGSLTSIGDKALIEVTDETTLTRSLWVSDGTDAGTRKISNVFRSSPHPLAILKGNAYFFSQNSELWKSNGTEVGTGIIKSNLYGMGEMISTSEQILFFSARTGIYKTDGTEAGTSYVASIQENSTKYYQMDLSIGGKTKIYFTAKSAIEGENLESVWVSDGTKVGTKAIFELDAARENTTRLIAVAEDVAYFITDEDNNGTTSLWKSSGTIETTVKVKDLGMYRDVYVGLGDVNLPSTQAGFWDGKRLLFPAQDDQHGVELWTSDGTAAGTSMVKDIRLGSLSSSPYSFVQAGSIVYFLATTDENGIELWSIDKNNNVKLLQEANPGIGSSLIQDIVPIGYGIVYNANNAEAWSYIPLRTAQTIMFDVISTKNSTDAPFAITATASSGLPIVFNIVSGPATLTANTITITGAGNVVVRATQAGDETHKPISAEQTFEVKLVVGLEDLTRLVRVYPNPASGTLYISVPAASGFKTFTMKDVFGRQIVGQNLAGAEASIDVTSVSKGLYIIRLAGENNLSYTARVVIK